MRPAIVLSVGLIALAVIINNLINPPNQRVDKHANTEQAGDSVTALPQLDLDPMVKVMRGTIEALQDVQKIMAEDAEVFEERDREQAMTDAAYTLAEAILEERAPNPVMGSAKFDETLIGMFVNPSDPNSPMKENAYDAIDIFVHGLSEREVAISQVTEDDPVFARRPKQEWKTAHIFIRVERTLENGTKQVSGVIISAPEPTEELQPEPTKKQAR